MSLKRCCCVSAMRNVRHMEIDDVGSDAIKTTQDVRGKRSSSSKRSLEVVGRPYWRLAIGRISGTSPWRVTLRHLFGRVVEWDNW